ncbi:hypothetical protein L3Y34_009762 [Caenorhabditis briggsae]|uniref:Uncharacterized protein n=1 Tax=Caenorhabditis briggsae TaxID=6238 RepID=A0AAE9A4W6_CAEBR|nr:hypothetical protein L3Y34_009762 [Caenorhabditis briggsae]
MGTPPPTLLTIPEVPIKRITEFCDLKSINSENSKQRKIPGKSINDIYLTLESMNSEDLEKLKEVSAREMRQDTENCVKAPKMRQGMESAPRYEKMRQDTENAPRH